MSLVPVPADQKWTWVVPSPGLVEIRGVGVSGPAGPAGPAGAPGPNQLLTGKTLWVDSVNGNDGTAVRGDAAKPYLTLAAAQTAALAGDTIVVRPGAYVVTATLGKHLVNWHFEAGTGVTRTETDPLADVAVWDDGGAAMTFTVTGAGTFTVVLTSNANDVDAAAIRVRHASSVVAVDCLDLIADDTAATFAGSGVRLDDGNLVVHCRDSSGSNAGVWWVNGELSVTGRECRSSRYAVYSTVNTAPTGDAYVLFSSIRNTGTDQAVLVEGTNANAALWVRAETVRGGSSGIAVTCQSPSGGNRLYVECQKVFGMVQEAGGFTSLLYLRADKVSPVVITSPLLYVGNGFAWVQVNDWDGVTLATQAIDVPAGSVDILGGRLVAGSTGISVNSGTLRMHGVHVSGNGTGLLMIQGNARLSGCFIDSSVSNVSNPVIKTGGTLTLANTTLVAHSTRNAIEVFSAQTVVINGTLTANRPSHASVSFTGGPVVRSDLSAFTSYVMEGTFTIRQPGGVAGTDQGEVRHDGSAFNFRNRDTGGYKFRNPADTADALSITDAGVVTTGSNLVVRQSGGVAGTDELLVSHNGTTAQLRNMDVGGIGFLNAAATVTTFSVTDAGIATALRLRLEETLGNTNHLEAGYDGGTGTFRVFSRVGGLARSLLLGTEGAVPIFFQTAGVIRATVNADPVLTLDTAAAGNRHVRLVGTAPGGSTDGSHGIYLGLSFNVANNRQFQVGPSDANAGDATFRMYFFNGMAGIDAVSHDTLTRKDMHFGNDTTNIGFGVVAGGADPIPATAKAYFRNESGKSFVFRAASGQTSDMVQVQNNVGTVELAFRAGGSIYSPPVTPAQITADQNDYAPGVARIYRLSSDASRTITGLVAGVNGEGRQVINVGGNNIVLAHESASSTAANRFLTSTGANVTVAPNEAVGLMYDGTDSRWRVFS